MGIWGRRVWGLRQKRKLDLVALALMDEGDERPALFFLDRLTARDPALPELVDLEVSTSGSSSPGRSTVTVTSDAADAGSSLRTASVK
jgi:hypothetical protein